MTMAMAAARRTFATADLLAAALADLVAAEVRRAAHYRLVLAGGSTPIRAYKLLAGMDVQWGKVSILFGDERCVPADHADSNYKAAADAFLTKAAPFAVYRMPGELGPEAAAKLYEAAVAAGPLDLVLLGIGPDGHTASLFPGNPALGAGGLATAVRDAPKPPPERVSLTLGALRAAKRVIILVAGADKREAVARAWKGEVPSGMIPGAEWWVTEDALPVPAG